jgi:mannose-1-phosphate guanylyltransferase
MYFVILAGGGGTRLWPLSRPDRPKPFLPLIDDRTLIQHTVDRLGGRSRLVAPSDVFVVTDRRYADLVHEQLPDIGGVLEEPSGRNTAAAIALAALAIDRADDDVMVVLPADHLIDPKREGVFREVLRAAARSLAGAAPFDIDAPLVTLGIQVDRPATEYGYLIPNVGRGESIDGLQAYPLRAFEEKPTAGRADVLRHEPGVAWNAGMFLWQRRAIIDALRRYANVLPALRPVIGSARALADAYELLPSISIDYAVMEPAAREGRVVMAAMDVGWSDLGGWTSLLDGIGARGTGRVVPAGEPVQLGPEDLLVNSDRHVPGGLAITASPSGTIRLDGPSALLAGAAPDRDRIEALLERVRAREAQPT